MRPNTRVPSPLSTKASQRRAGCTLAAWVAFSQLATAAAPAPESAASPDDEVHLPAMVVTATRTAKSVEDAPASVTVFEQERIELRHVERVGDILKEAPGLYLWGSSLGSSTPTAARGRISMRGIPGSARTLVLIDNQPLNDAYLGNVNWSSIFMEDVDRIEVLPGAASALYGGNAYAGVIHVLTKEPREREFFAKSGYEFGRPDSRFASFVYHDRFANGIGLSLGYRYEESTGFEDTLIVKTPAAGAPATNAVSGAVATTTTTGAPAFLVGDIGKQPWNYHSAQAKFFYDLSEDSKFSAGLTYFQSDVDLDDPHTYLHDAAGLPATSGTYLVEGQRIVLTARDFVANGPAHDDVLRAFGTWDHAFSEELALKTGLSFADRDYRFTSPGGTASTAGGIGSLTAAPTTGLDAFTQLSAQLGEPHLLTVGVAFNRGELDRESANLADWRERDSRTTSISGSDGVNTTVSGFLQEEYRIHERVTLYLGGRVDAWSTHGSETVFTSTNSMRSDFGDHSEVQFSPRGSAVIDLWKGATLKGSAGTAFRPPTLFDLYVTSRRGTTASLSNPDLDPETSLNWEVGLAQHFSSGTRVQATYFHSDLEDLIYNRTVASGPGGTTNRVINAGAARSHGFELTASQELAPWLDLHLSYTFTETEVLENDADPLSIGKRLTSSPRNLFTGTLEGHSGEWSGSLIGRFVDDMFDTSQNTDVLHDVYGGFEAHWLMDAKVSWQPRKWATLSFAINNVTETEYYQFIANPGRTYALEAAFQF